MKTALQRIQEAVPPPTNPTHAGRDWSKTEAALGWSLPSDYKSFIESYGSGGFFPVEVFVWNYSHSLPDHDRLMESLESMEDVDDGISLPEVHKNTPLYLWGQDGVGCKYFWARDGEPDQWYVIATMGRLDFRRFADLCMTEFLAKLVERDKEITTLLWDDIVTAPIEFRPSE